LIFNTGGWRARVAEEGEKLEVDYTLVGRIELAEEVNRAIEEAASRGLGRRRSGAELERVDTLLSNLTGAEGVWRESRSLELTFLTPLRLKKDGRYLKRFDPEALGRDLMFRLAALGHHHAALPWPAPWREILEQARAARVVSEENRWVRPVRYSARQRRGIVLGGVLGTVRIESVEPLFGSLLRAGEVIHAGKGVSVGLGEYRVSPLVGCADDEVAR